MLGGDFQAGACPQVRSSDKIKMDVISHYLSEHMIITQCSICYTALILNLAFLIFSKHSHFFP